MSPHSNRSYETSSRKIRALRSNDDSSNEWRPKKRTITGLGPVHTDRDIFETAYFVIQIGVDRDLNHFGTRFPADAVSVSKFHWFRVKADSFRKYVVSKISGLEWTWPYYVHHAFLYTIFVATVRLRRAIKMPTFTFYGGHKSAESDVTRRRDNNLQRQFSVGHSITTLLQHCLNSYNIDPTLQRCTCVALKIVVVNSLVDHHHLKQKDDEIFFLFGLNIILS